MMPKLVTVPKQREFESSYSDYVCPYCGAVYSVSIYMQKEIDGDMKCAFCGKEWKEGEE